MRRLAMRGIKSFGIGLKRSETGFGAKVNRPPAIFGARKILRIGIVKNSSAKSDEVRRANLDQFRFFHLAFYCTSVLYLIHLTPIVPQPLCSRVRRPLLCVVHRKTPTLNPGRENAIARANRFATWGNPSHRRRYLYKQCICECRVHRCYDGVPFE